VAAAHEDLALLAARGAFRHDLYYRLVHDGILTVPPLRERREDVPVLVRDFVGRAGASLEPGALDELVDYEWPGNVRQLLTVARIAVRLGQGVLTAEAAEIALRRFAQDPVQRRMPLVPRLEDAAAAAAEPCAVGAFHAITARAQRRALVRAFEASNGNKTAAGVLLGFHLSPGERPNAERPLTEARRNLALRKFRYWSARLGLTALLGSRAGGAGPPPGWCSAEEPQKF
jgi:transcriptional regulator with GAF, ATPase, and Fis domain